MQFQCLSENHKDVNVASLGGSLSVRLCVSFISLTLSLCFLLSPSLSFSFESSFCLSHLNVTVVFYLL